MHFKIYRKCKAPCGSKAAPAVAADTPQQQGQGIYAGQRCEE